MPLPVADKISSETELRLFMNGCISLTNSLSKQSHLEESSRADTWRLCTLKAPKVLACTCHHVVKTNIQTTHGPIEVTRRYMH